MKTGSQHTGQGQIRRAGTLYRIAVENAGWNPDEVRRRYKWRAEDLAAAMRQLRELRLFVSCETTPSGVLAISPRTALAMLQRESVGYAESALTALRRTAKATMDVAVEFEEIHARSPLSGNVRLIEGNGDACGFTERALGLVRHEFVAICDAGALTDGFLKAVETALPRTVTARIVCRLPTARPYAPLIGRLVAMPAEIRTAGPVPVSLALVDRTSAMIPLPPDGVPGGGLLVVESAALVTWLQELFGHFWAVSSTLPRAGHAHRTPDADLAGGSSGAPGAAELPGTDLERALLHLLTSGLTDKSISRKLGIHERTVRRRVSHLLAMLGAQSRFQGGVRAVRAGWLTGNHLDLEREAS